MKKILIFFIIYWSSIFILYGESTKFSDDFIDTSFISYSTNILITNSTAILSNTGKNGILISDLITLESNESWSYLYIDYSITNSNNPKPKIFFNILDSSGNKTSFTNLQSDIIDISGLTNKSIKLEAILVRATVTGNGTPLLNQWKVTINIFSTVESNLPLYSDRFYGAPTPFKSSDSNLRFYYTFNEDSYVTLEIYDSGYNLVKIIEDNRFYSGGSSLDATWDGRNGNGIKVSSGLYMAKIIIKDKNNSIKDTYNFPFGVIR